EGQKRALLWERPLIFCVRGELFPLANVDIIAPRGAGVELTRTADALARIFDHLVPLRDPADRARESEENREHGGRETHRLERDARIEVDVEVELLLDEVFVVESDLLEFQRHIQKRIVLDAQNLENLMAGLLHHPRAGVVVFVNAVSKAH